MRTISQQWSRLDKIGFDVDGIHLHRQHVCDLCGQNDMLIYLSNSVLGIHFCQQCVKENIDNYDKFLNIIIPNITISITEMLNEHKIRRIRIFEVTSMCLRIRYVCNLCKRNDMLVSLTNPILGINYCYKCIRIHILREKDFQKIIQQDIDAHMFL
jgi:hypothetical protein